MDNYEIQGAQYKYRWSKKGPDRFEIRNAYNRTPNNNTYGKYRQGKYGEMNETEMMRYRSTPQRYKRNMNETNVTPKNRNYEYENKQERPQIIYMPFPQYTQPMQYQTYSYQQLPERNCSGQQNRMFVPTQAPPQRAQQQQQQA